MYTVPTLLLAQLISDVHYYLQEDNKEHSFEVSLFAELFNEMLMRDFAFRIYRALCECPEKPAKEEVSLCILCMIWYF